MKKIALLLLLIISVTACTNDDVNQQTYNYEVLPVASYTLPEKLILGETHEIKLKYQKPSACHIFKGIYYNPELNKRTIAIQTAVNKDENCIAVHPDISEVSFNFYVTNMGSYIFKFYKGKDVAGIDVYEEKEVPVVK